MTDNIVPKHVLSNPVAEDYMFADPNNIFMDLFKNEFDTTWMINTEQKTFSIIEPEKETIDNGLVVYNYNKQKFRSDDFTNVHNGKHILCAIYTHLILLQISENHFYNASSN